MIGYLCATPFHITAAITMQSGMFADRKATLIILNHFNADEEFIGRIKDTGIFDEVLLFDSKYASLMDNIKRLINAFVPAKLMRNIANKTSFSHFVCFALDFIDLTYIMKRYEKRGISCEFSFGDDGIGTYIREGIYKPKEISRKLLKLNGRTAFLDKVSRVYAYKPSLMVANKTYDVLPILQDKTACGKRREAVCRIWPLTDEVNIDNSILYFEQPMEAGTDDTDQKIEQDALRMAIGELKAPSAVKMHPRSTAEKAWKEFGIINTKMPYEVMLLQKQCSPVLMMTVSSTALFSTYLFDDLPAACCPSVLLYKLMNHTNDTINKAMSELCRAMNDCGSAKVYDPDTPDELHRILKDLSPK